MRCFLGIKPNPVSLATLLGQIAKVRQTLVVEPEHQWRWQTGNQLHLTLIFLGSIDDHQRSKLCQMLPQLTQKLPAFTLTGTSSILLPSKRHPKCWALETDTPPALQILQQTTSDLCRLLGNVLEKGRYRPHITLARLRSDKPPMVDLGDFPPFSFLAESVSLFSSQPTPAGSEYRIEATFSLKGKIKAE